MPIKDILVHLDDSKHCAKRVRLAAALAAEHQAHLAGLFAIRLPQIPAYVRAEMGENLDSMARQATLGAALKAKSIFDSETAKAGIAGEWREASGDPVDALCVHGRYVDLIVMGQTDPDEEHANGDSDLADHVVLEVGKPVLMIPYAGEFETLGRRVLVAWNASRESTRAVTDSLPILRRAAKVWVMAINPKGGQQHGQMPSADIGLHLARQGVKVEAAHLIAEDIDPGNLLLSRAADEDADLIVMGAYGRSRLRELVLGGATRHMMKHMTVPVLMSH